MFGLSSGISFQNHQYSQNLEFDRLKRPIPRAESRFVIGYIWTALGMVADAISPWWQFSHGIVLTVDMPTAKSNSSSLIDSTTIPAALHALEIVPAWFKLFHE
jgi:hypothetical protein